jgi:hypothetical protein
MARSFRGGDVGKELQIISIFFFFSGPLKVGEVAD